MSDIPAPPHSYCTIDNCFRHGLYEGLCAEHHIESLETEIRKLRGDLNVRRNYADEVQRSNKLEVRLRDTADAELEASKKRHKAQYAIADHIVFLEAEIAALEGRQVRLFNQGYMLGHHDTVEGMFTDLHPDDMDTYHDDVVAEILAEESTL